jgi:hypothetical protein
MLHSHTKQQQQQMRNMLSYMPLGCSMADTAAAASIHQRAC